MFMGSSYGETCRPGDEDRKPWYVDLRRKDDKEMLNLAIVKLKIEMLDIFNFLFFIYQVIYFY